MHWLKKQILRFLFFEICFTREHFNEIRFSIKKKKNDNDGPWMPYKIIRRGKWDDFLDFSVYSRTYRL